MRRWLAALALLAFPVLAAEEEPAWATGSWASGSWASGSWDGDTVVVPNVVGEADALAADAILEGVGLDLGTETEVCSSAADNEIVGQAPSAGTIAVLGSLVDVTSSNGAACNGRPSLWLQAPIWMEMNDEEE